MSRIIYKFNNIKNASNAEFFENFTELYQEQLRVQKQIDSEESQRKLFDEFKNNFISQFLFSMKDEVIEDGMYNKIDYLCEKYYRQNPIYFLSAVNELFNKNLGNKNIILFILSALSKFTYEQMQPNGYTMIMLAVNHIDIEIKDLALKVIDIWGPNHFRDGVKSIEINCKWMKDYFDELFKE